MADTTMSTLQIKAQMKERLKVQINVTTTVFLLFQ